MRHRQAVDEAGGEGQRRGKDTAGGEDNPQKEQVLRHGLRITGMSVARPDGSSDER